MGVGGEVFYSKKKKKIDGMVENGLEWKRAGNHIAFVHAAFSLCMPS